MGPNSTGKSKLADGHVGHIGIKVVAATSRHLFRHFIDQPQNNRYVMGSKRPKDIFFTTDFAQIKAMRIDIL